MKILNLLLFGLIILSLSISSSCTKKKGCTDVNASNYCDDCKEDDGTCISKDQNAVNTLGGTWKASSYKVNSKEQIPDTISEFSLSFITCEQKTASCKGSAIAKTKINIQSTVYETTFTQEFTFTVSGDGKKINSTEVQTTTKTLPPFVFIPDTTEKCIQNCLEVWDVVELTSTKLIVSGKDEDGALNEVILSK